MMRAPRRTLAATMLVLEAFVVFFAGLVAKDLTDLGTGPALGLHGGLSLACLVIAGLLRLRVGYLLGGLLQLAVIATGYWVPVMYAIGVLFAALWFTALVVGSRIERERSMPPGDLPGTR
jgi:hypothetical protein